MILPLRSLSKHLKSIDSGGSVAVEYALTFPYLVALMYGIFEVCHFAYIQTTISNIAQDAVRYAVVHSTLSAQPQGASDVTSYVNSELSGLGFYTSGVASTNVTVTYNPDASPGSTVRVQISYPFEPFMGGFHAIPGSRSSFTTLTGPIVGNAQMVVNP